MNTNLFVTARRLVAASALLIPAALAAAVPGQAGPREDDVMAVQTAYEKATAAGDLDGVANLFNDGGAFLPPVGGVFVGGDQIRAAMMNNRPGSVDIVSTDISAAGDATIDIGTFTFTPADGGPGLAGEYVAVLSNAGDGPKLDRLVLFPPRMPPPQR